MRAPLEHGAGSLVQEGEVAPETAIRLGRSLDATCLPIQGPPGSGKTYTGAEMIVDLIRPGAGGKKKVGICANSHKVIGNLLEEICKHADRQGVNVSALQKAEEHERCGSDAVQCTGDSKEIEAALEKNEVDLVAGTSWLFARETMEGRLDTLFVDEAGQMSLANVLAISGTAANVVLLGDPQQLEQPSKGAHPTGAERSALSHALIQRTQDPATRLFSEEQLATIPPERGLFLDTTWRLHPGICRFISEVSYEGRLHPDPSTSRQMLHVSEESTSTLHLLEGTGLRYVPVEHEGNRIASTEEAEAVAALVRGLLGMDWTGRHGAVQSLQMGDVLVVAPYNAHVARLAEDLPKSARIGTVDKFQGQEAPVVFYSMATSTAEDLPRNMEFLYSLNRLNVAISRGQGLAVLVCSPKLLQVRCKTPEQMHLANALCRFVEMAETVSGMPAPRFDALGGGE